MCFSITRSSKKKWLWFVLLISAASAIYLRIAAAAGSEMRHWTDFQRASQKATDDQGAPRFLCVGQFAFDLGDGFPVLEEQKILIPRAKNQIKCLPWWVPTRTRHDIALAVVDSSVSWGATLLFLDGSKKKNIDTVAAELENAGFRESGGSIQNRSTHPVSPVRLFDRGEGWLLLVAVNWADGAIFMAGYTPPHGMERFR